MNQQMPCITPEHTGVPTIPRWGLRKPSDSIPNLECLALHELLYLSLQSHRDELLWTEFIRRTQPIVTGAIIKAIRRWSRSDQCLVDDLMQETYLKLCAHDFKPLRRFVCYHGSSLYGFLRAVAENTVQDHYRSIHSQKRGSGKEQEDIETAMLKIGQTIALSRSIEHRLLIQQIDACLLSCPVGHTFVRDHTVFWLYYRDGLTASEISRLPGLDLSLKGVESLLLRMARMVKQRLMV